MLSDSARKSSARRIKDTRGAIGGRVKLHRQAILKKSGEKKPYDEVALAMLSDVQGPGTPQGAVSMKSFLTQKRSNIRPPRPPSVSAVPVEAAVAAEAEVIDVDKESSPQNVVANNVLGNNHTINISNPCSSERKRKSPRLEAAQKRRRYAERNDGIGGFGL